MDITLFNHQLLEFLDQSPTPYHAVKNLVTYLKKAGYERLSEASTWQLTLGQGYFVTRNDGSIIAFMYGQEDILKTGIRMVGAHTDSPCLKVKPNAELFKQSYLQLGVEVYGGALLHPWFDRDLSLAGKVIYQDSQKNLHSTLLDFNDPIASIPSLAIHLDRDANKNHSINPQTDIPPVLMQLDKHSKQQAYSFKDILKKQLKSQNTSIDIEHIIDFELSFYDTQQASYLGLQKDFIASSRLDNLLSCYIAVQSLLHANKQGTFLICCSDHEEVGSASSSGAQGSFLKSVLERLSGSNTEAMTCMINQSMLISADNAHAVHPNFSDKHDAQHSPIINQGPVIKVNANQRYASNCETGAIFKILAEHAQVPVQSFVVRTDMGCGSTIGPIVATQLGIKTLDIGVPTLAMHSIRELCGQKDAWYLFKVLMQFSNHHNRVHIQ
ncbi:MAG: M18 family aminopeptidase [Gammaproteobacteria bacterium]|nr:M18 family aminopeptidase [Gammaproteobacteria bacterium]